MMKPVDGQPGVFTTESDKAPEFKIGDRVRVNLKAARACGYTGPEVGVIDKIDDCCARIAEGGKGPFVSTDDLELLTRTSVVRYKGRVEPSGALAELSGTFTELPLDPAKVLTYYGDQKHDAQAVHDWGKDLAGITKCLRCGGPAGYLGLRCERVGGCRTAEERVGEPPPGTIQKGRWRRTDEPSWSWNGAGPRAWATEVLAIAAWKAVRLAELESIERGLR